MLALHQVTKSFGELLALDQVDFEVAPGRLTGFVGGNGAGKTTTMRIVLGVLAADSGQVSLDGRPLTSADRRRFGYMPEERGLYPKQPIIDQLVYLGQLHSLSRSDARRRAMELLARFGLDDRAKSKLESLSLGNQQRVQVAAALLHEPEVLILDEPFSGLDPLAVDAMSSILRDYASRGVPVLFSSHQLDLLDVLVDHLVIIQDGRILANASAETLRSSQATRHKLSLGADAGWLRDEPGVEVIDISGSRALVNFQTESDSQRVLREALSLGTVTEFAIHRPALADIYREIIK